MARMVGINHLAVEVDDIDAAIEFFERLFDDVRLRGWGARMAFVDIGDQFVALAQGRTQPADTHRHIGLVVDDRDEVLRRAREAGATMRGDNDFLDPSGNLWQIVDYRDVQFTKAPRILEGMGLRELEKSPRAVEELRMKGLAD